jgi:hypothetical protein
MSQPFAGDQVVQDVVFALRACSERFESSCPAGSGEVELLLARSLRHGANTATAAGVLLASGLPTQAFAVTRGFVELSTRILWASREPQGWKRLLSYHAREHAKWDRKLGATTSWRLTALDALAQAPSIPDLLQMFDRIYALDVKLAPQVLPGWGQEMYTSQFCFLHSAAHGDPFLGLLTDENGIPGHVPTLLGLFCLSLLRGVYEWAQWPHDAAIDEVCESLMTYHQK